ncbi:MAG: hybrid sensor histidine kinase/response regulator, partial [Dissulfurimicrobium sp.]
GVLKAAFEGMVGRVKENMAEIVRQLKIVKERGAERDEALKASQLNEERLTVTIRCMGDGVISTDLSSKVTLINKTAERLLGISHVQAIGKEIGEIFTINDENGHNIDPVRDALTQNRLIESRGRESLVPKTRGGFDCAYACSPILDSSSCAIGTVFVFRDITEHNRLVEQALIAEKLESVGLLAGGIAHDFNNILTPIHSGISAALSHINEPQRLEKLLRPALKAAERAVGLTHQLLTFAKGGEPVKEDASLEEIVKDTAGFVLSGASIICHYEFAPNLWLASVDKRQISQVIQNIVLNARQAMKNNGLITIRAENLEYTNETGCEGEKDIPLAPGRYVKLTIEDSGSGIPQHILDRIFEPYFTTKTEGSGLGLAVTRSIVTRHGGHITVSSNKGKGASFTIYLPASSGHALGHTLHVGPSEHTKRDGRLILMDDDEMILELAKILLEDMGYQVLTARDGRQAVDLYKAAMNEGRPVSAVIMDITVLGGMGAKETMPELLKIDPGCKGVVSSGYSQDPIMSNYKEYGFAAALPKPYRMEDLAAMLDKIQA